MASLYPGQWIAIHSEDFMTQYVQLSPDTTQVYAVYSSPQSYTTAIDDNDARFLAFQAVMAANVLYTAAVNSGVAITSTGTSALNGTYALSDQTYPIEHYGRNKFI